MLPALHLIEQLLRAYGRTYAANLAAIAIGQYQRDPLAACRTLNCAEWWEDSDSMAAIDLAVEGGFTAQARQDSLAYRRALSEVHAGMQAFGEHNETGALMVAQFLKWEESHI